MLCEDNMNIIETKSALLVPQSAKQATSMKTLNNTGKINKHYTNCGMTNHNVETHKKKKEQTTMATIKAAQPSQKPQKTSSYACHICGLHGYEMTYCPKFIKM